MAHLLAGATGLIGSELRRLLEQANQPVHLLVRRDIEARSSTETVQVIDFTRPDLPACQADIDWVFCALGTTIKKAGSKAAFEAVDLQAVVDLGAEARRQGYQNLAVVSSLGADASTGNFYLQTKGRMEQALMAQGWDKLVIVQPSLLLGDREEFRLGERVGAIIGAMLSPFLRGSLAHYRPIQGSQVARALLTLSQTAESGTARVKSGELRRLASQH